MRRECAVAKLEFERRTLSDSTETIECHHGTTWPAFVCQHLTAAGCAGFHRAEDDEDPWPDAWCDACEGRLADVDYAWTQEIQDFTGIRAVCGHCWDDAFLANSRVLRDPIANERLIREACNALTAKEAEWTERFDADSHPRFDWDDDEATFTLGMPGSAVLRSRMCVVGSWGRESESWLWSWANPSYAEIARTPLVKVKRFGENAGVEQLIRPLLTSVKEEEGWHLAALAARVLGAEAAYRAPHELGSTFLLLFDTEYVS